MFFVISHWIEPMRTPETRDTVLWESKHFAIRYQEDSPAWQHRKQLATSLEDELADLVDLLQVDQASIPVPIDVFAHDNMDAMLRSIALRKSPSSEGVYLAPLDMLVDEPVRPRLAELVLAFGWGECGSQLLYFGVSKYASQPERNFHATVSALPQRLFLSLSELIHMKEKGEFALSLYQAYDSPYCSASLTSLSDFKEFREWNRSSLSQSERLSRLEAASFVQFLMETLGGIDEVRRGWGAGGTKRLLGRISSDSIASLGASWRKWGLRYGEGSADYPYYRAYYLLASGAPDSAYEVSQGWNAGDLSAEELILKARCALAVGEFGQAATIADRLADSEAASSLRRLINAYEGGTSRETASVRVLAPAQFGDDVAAMLSMMADTYDDFVGDLQLEQDEQPNRLTVFIHPNKQVLAIGEGLEPMLTAGTASLYLSSADAFGQGVAELLPRFAWGKDTYSSLLCTGLTVALSWQPGYLVSEGCRLIKENEWVSLDRVGFGSTDAEIVKIQAGLLLRFLLDNFGGQIVKRIWIATSPLDQHLALDTAIEELCGIGRGQIGENIRSEVLDCN